MRIAGQEAFKVSANCTQSTNHYACEGKNHRQIARELKISRDTARHWQRRWLDMAGDSFSTLGPIYITSPVCCGDILKHIANRLHTRASVLHFQGD
ncbi:MAG: helix-turn-helix domain-containing protein [Methanosarcinales archaeon]